MWNKIVELITNILSKFNISKSKEAAQPRGKVFEIGSTVLRIEDIVWFRRLDDKSVEIKLKNGDLLVEKRLAYKQLCDAFIESGVDVYTDE